MISRDNYVFKDSNMFLQEFCCDTFWDSGKVKVEEGFGKEHVWNLVLKL